MCDPISLIAGAVGLFVSQQSISSASSAADERKKAGEEAKKKAAEEKVIQDTETRKDRKDLYESTGTSPTASRLKARTGSPGLIQSRSFFSAT